MYPSWLPELHNSRIFTTQAAEAIGEAMAERVGLECSRKPLSKSLFSLVKLTHSRQTMHSD